MTRLIIEQKKIEKSNAKKTGFDSGNPNEIR
jgi:hypothetical protein